MRRHEAHMSEPAKEPGINARGDLAVRTPLPRVLLIGTLAGLCLALILVQLVRVAA
jgi:hypothetical protein